MRLLGIDYGRKNIGVALSDETKTIATPLCILENTSKLTLHIESLAHKHDVEAVILGASYDFKGADNPLMKDIKVFRANLAESLHIPIIFESEVLTSAQAARHEIKRELRDASAAALILQSYIDKDRAKRSNTS